jgi:hypothetical protein
MCDLCAVTGRTCEKEAKDVFIFSPIFETVEEAVQVSHRGRTSSKVQTEAKMKESLSFFLSFYFTDSMVGLGYFFSNMVDKCVILIKYVHIFFSVLYT